MSFESTDLILHTQMEDIEGKTPIDFGVKGQDHTDMFSPFSVVTH